MTIRSLPAIAAVLFTACAEAQVPSPVKVQLQSYVNGLPNVTDITHAGDERLFVALRNGTIRIINGDGQLLPNPFLTISVNSSSTEQGLLGLAFDPDYATNGYFYVNYIQNDNSTRIARYKVSDNDPNTADPNSAVTVLTVAQPFSNHNGGDLAFGPDGYLYISLGDGGSGGDPANNGQKMNTLLGKILRIDVSSLPYTIPPDNPFVGATGDTLPEIWASGLRNPWRFGFDRETGDMWIGDVGQNSWEEIDFWPADDHSGPNFGWRCYEGFANFSSGQCNEVGTVPPVRTHPTSQWCSIIGGRVYRGANYYRLVGRYLYTDYCDGKIHSLHRNDNLEWVPEQLTTTGGNGPSVIAENVHGELFVGYHHSANGRVMRLVDVCPMPQPTITVDGNVLTASAANGYVWFLDGQVIPGATEQSIEATTSGHYSVLADHGTDCKLMSQTVFHSSTGIAQAPTPGVQVGPVPAQDRLTVDGLVEGAAFVRLMDTAGRIQVDEHVNGAGTLVLDVSGLSAGSYVLKVLDKTGSELMHRVVSVVR